MTSEYIRDCVNVMMTGFAATVIVICLFVCYTLILWAATMTRNFVRESTPPNLTDEMLFPIPPTQPQQPQPSANGIGVRRTHFQSNGE